MPKAHLETLSPDSIMCSGFCAACGREHGLPVGPAAAAARDVVAALEANGRMDYDLPQDEADPRFSLEYLWGEARGQMLGVMTYVDASGAHGVLKAFSCQYNGAWNIMGWVPPIIDVEGFHRIGDPVERQIKALGREMAEHPKGSAEYVRLKRERKAMSQKLMKDFHALYRLHNFRSEVRPMTEVFLGGGGVPTGVGDCCAPKLLHHAANMGYTPTGIVEFYWGRENRSGTRRHGECYPACTEKCRPILGFMLCGLEEYTR